MKSTFSILGFLLLLAIGAEGFTTQSPLSSSALRTATSPRTADTRLYFDIGSMIRNFGKKASASHILIGPVESKTGRGMLQDDAIAKLKELKAEINDDPEKFAEYAKQYSSCRSSAKGGDLETFGPGMMVKQFDKVCFEDEVGVVHGPISTAYGEHLIFVRERTGDEEK
mmetsp:Transcript_15946/g.36788  ORF Transcript_15946/g.36788 Transcript_15946/m.36788 type:complete len:169 (+) Transcript_15946:166-672(+)